MTDPVAERDAGVMAAATQIVDDMIRPLPTSEERRELRDAIYDFGIALVLSERQRGREEMRDRRIADLEAGLETADSWLMFHARHVGSCIGKSLCTCGLTLVRAETGALLSGQQDTGQE